MSKRVLGRLLIFLGVLVWLPYIVLKLLSAEVEVAPFLLVHLSLVIPGAILAPGERLYKLLRWKREPPLSLRVKKKN